jgi:hypothetical protein
MFDQRRKRLKRVKGFYPGVLWAAKARGFYALAL